MFDDADEQLYQISAKSNNLQQLLSKLGEDWIGIYTLNSLQTLCTKGDIVSIWLCAKLNLYQNRPDTRLY